MNDDGQYHQTVGQWEEYELTHVYPPIPIRSMDWRATRKGYEPGDPMGYGRTEQEAITDLLENEE